MIADVIAGQRLEPPGEREPNERLRIVSVTRRLTVAGDETRLLNTALAYDRDRVDHTIVVFSAGGKDDEHWTGAMLATYRAAGVDVISLDLKLEGSATALDVARILPRLVRVVRRMKPHVLDARLGLPTVFGLLAARLSGVPVVTTTAYYPSIWRPPFKYLVGQAALAAVDALISDARSTLDDFDAWRWSKRAELVFIPNGVAPVSSTLTREEARHALGLPTDPDVRVVGQVSRIIARKGYETFLDAARLLVDRDPTMRFVGVGYVAEDRSYLKELEARRTRLGLDEHVRLLHYPGPIGDVYAALDVFTHLSTQDSSPIAIHERMSIGVPSVITALPGNLEIVDPGVDALVVPPGDAHATADAVLRLLEDPDLGHRIGDAAMARYGAHHRPEHMAQAHEKLFRRLVAERR